MNSKILPEVVVRILVLSCFSIFIISIISLLLKLIIFLSSIPIISCAVIMLFFGISTFYFGLMYNDNFTHIKNNEEQEIQSENKINNEPKEESTKEETLNN